MPENLTKKCKEIYSELVSINSLKISRGLGNLSKSRLEIHGFGDVSKDAICATVYFRFLADDKSTVNLLVAKIKVAPLKTQSIPRLELCASLLLCKLVCSTLDNFKFSQVPIQLWSDSQVDLCWIVSDPYLWQVFVANRVKPKFKD